MRSEEEMFDMLEDDVICPMCKKSFLEEIPDFIMCYSCGLKIRTEISLKKFKYTLELNVNRHSENCLQAPDFSLMFENNATALWMSCSACPNYYLIRTMEL